MEEAGVMPGTIRARFVFLQTVLAAKKGASAVHDGLIDTSLCFGVDLPHVPTRDVSIYEPEDCDLILEATPAYWRPLALSCSETGMRWGELMGVGVSDFELDYRAVVRRTIVQTRVESTGNGAAFAWKDCPKGKRPRRVVLSPEARAAVKQLVAERELAAGDRLFSMPARIPRARRVQVLLTEEVLAAAGDFAAPAVDGLLLMIVDGLHG